MGFFKAVYTAEATKAGEIAKKGNPSNKTSSVPFSNVLKLLTFFN